MFYLLQLSGCVGKNYNNQAIALPDMPIAGLSVAKEISEGCGKEKCPHTAKWLNDLYLFREKYIAYKAALEPGK
jgi:hypothetical protein